MEPYCKGRDAPSRLQRTSSDESRRCCCLTSVVSGQKAVLYIDCIHTDICEQSVITCWLSAIQMVIIQIQAIPHKTRKHIWKLLKKPIAKLRPHQMTGASQRASRAITRERQNSNKQFSVYLTFVFFLGWSHSVWTLPATKSCCFFLPPRRCFWA